MTVTVEVVRSTLAWCSVINLILLAWWGLFFFFAHDWTYRMHSKWFQIPVEKFDSIHYTGIAFYKMAILLFNLVPYLSLRIVG